jgi:uncharacterized protein with FMN-binding domain
MRTARAYGAFYRARGLLAMKKLVVSITIIGLFVIYSIAHARSGTLAFAPVAGSAAPTHTPDPATGNPPADGSSPTATPVPGAKFKDGAYTGSAADAQWGYIQVKALVKGGKITDVQFVQYPNERSRSVEINQYADPILTSEAIQAQSAQVDVVTGATDSSVAFMQSLGDALSQAQA